MFVNIIDTFNCENDIYKVYPKKTRLNVRDIFDDYWIDFQLYADKLGYKIRNVVKKEVNKMLKCRTPLLGYNLYKCPNCNYEHFQYNTCKSRFCNSCGVKYAKERTINIMSKLINCPHRHLTFTIPDILWPLFREDRKRINLLFEAVNITISSWFKEQKKNENFKPGFISTIHTFGRDNKWNTHIHCLIAEMAMGDNTIYKKIDFFPFPMLRKRFQKVLLDLLSENIGKDIFRPIRNKIYLKSENGFYVRAKRNEFPNSKKALEYILRYCGRPAFASYRIISIDNGYIAFWYQRHDDDLFVVEKIHIFEFIKRLIIHIHEYQFKTIRYYGFYSSSSHKRYNQFKLLVDKDKLPFFKSLNRWRMMLISSFKRDPLKCPNCGTIMEFQYVYT